MTIEVQEEQRQFILLSLGLCALLRPGFRECAGEIADALSGREMFEGFIQANDDWVKPQNVQEDLLRAANAAWHLTASLLAAPGATPELIQEVHDALHRALSNAVVKLAGGTQP